MRMDPVRSKVFALNDPSSYDEITAYGRDASMNIVIDEALTIRALGLRGR